jgi:hypothetical protein
VLLYDVKTDYSRFGVGLSAVVKRDLSEIEREKVVLGIYMKKENLTEDVQWLGDIIGAHTHYAEEDLTSDLIAFYLMINNKRNPKDDEASWEWLAEMCDYPKDHSKAIEKSKAVWKNGAYNPVDNWNLWGNPRLCETSECQGERKWPSKFAEVVPDMPDNQNGYWWEYSISDGIPFASNDPGVYFLDRKHHSIP